MDLERKCYFVPGVQVWERHFCGKNTQLSEKEKKPDVTNEYEIAL